MSAPQKTYVLDTSVLIADPKAIERFDEHAVVVPAVVLDELEKKRSDPEIGYYARQSLHVFEALRTKHGDLSTPMPIGPAGGTVVVELNHVSQKDLPAAFRSSENDARILAVASNLAREDHDVTVVSKDLPLRVKAGAVGLKAEEYLHQQVKDSGWNGVVEVHTTTANVSALYAGKQPDLGPVFDAAPANAGIIFKAQPTGSGLAVTDAVGGAKVIRDLDVFGLKPSSAEQKIAATLLLNNDIGIVSLGGRAGTGKTALALAAGLEAVLERGDQKKIIVLRPVYAVGNQDLGYLPGSADEKMDPWAQAVWDAIESFASEEVLDEVKDRGLIEVLPLTHLRGRSLNDAFIILDEAQSLELNVLVTVLTRTGRNSRIVLTHDVAQRDNLRVGRHDGIRVVVEKLKGQALFGHIELRKSQRSAIAALASDLLDDGTL